MKKILFLAILMFWGSIAISKDKSLGQCDKAIPRITKNMVNGGYTLLRSFLQSSEFYGRAEFFADRGSRVSFRLVIVVVDSSVDANEYLPATAEDTGLTCKLKNGNNAKVYKFLTLADPSF